MENVFLFRFVASFISTCDTVKIVNNRLFLDVLVGYDMGLSGEYYLIWSKFG